MIRSISESHDRTGWPHQILEVNIVDWIDGDDRYDIPFDDRNEITTAKFYQRLGELRNELGGWLCSDETNHIRFVMEPEWQQIRTTRINKWEADMNWRTAGSWKERQARAQAQRRNMLLRREAKA